MPKHRLNQFFTIRNREVDTKHVFAGGTRLVSKLVKAPNVVDLDGDGIPDDMPNACSEPWGWTNGNGGQGNGQGPCNNNGNSGQNGNGGNNSTGPEVFEKDQYYYHPDHLGSSSYVTDLDGEIFQHLEYFPFGETWVEEHHDTQRTPYLFTSKEFDEETGLYHFGARYYDPRTSVWQSPDPIPSEYLNGTRSGNGIFEPASLSLYAYVQNKPVVVFDPNGESCFTAYLGSYCTRSSKYEGYHARSKDRTAFFGAAHSVTWFFGATQGLGESSAWIFPGIGGLSNNAENRMEEISGRLEALNDLKFQEIMSGEVNADTIGDYESIDYYMVNQEQSNVQSYLDDYKKLIRKVMLSSSMR